MAKKIQSARTGVRKATRSAKKTANPVRKSTASQKTRPVKAAKRSKRAAARPKAMSVGRRILALEEQILKEKRQLAALRKKLAPVEVPDYVFKAHDGSDIRLSEMFGAHKDLIMVHNMGKHCPYCTLWADGFVGFTKHLENRAAFVVVSKDDVATQREFYQGRGWNFRMYSSHETTFNRDVKFETVDGGQMPGVSAFFRDNTGRIFRAAYTYFGPGDDFCALWHMLDLLKEGPDGWEPKYRY